MEPHEKRAILTTIVDRIELTQETLVMRVLPRQLLSILRGSDAQSDRARSTENTEPLFTLVVLARLKRAGMETKLLINGAGGGARRTPDHSLYRVLAQARRYNAMVMRNGGKTMAELAAEAGVGGSYFTRILRLSFLAPDVVQAILRDNHPVELTAKRMSNGTRIPIRWEEQRALLDSR